MAKGRFEEWQSESNLLLLEGWARNGLNDEQIAHNIGINPSTLYNWKAKYPKIAEALQKGKEVVDIIVENAMFKRAIGYDCEEVIQEIRGDKKVIKKTTRHIPGDVTAQIFWLKNRKPELWRDRPTEKTEKYEDDGLSAALAQSVDEEMQDDSFMIPPEEESNND